jgi:aminoglycoside phosphotransferase family enzyme
MIPSMKKKEIKRLIDSLVLFNQGEKPVLIETHISWVILSGAFAYKIKKPVHFSFLDFSSLKKRKACCECELALNRRLAPHMYLRVVAVYQNGSDFSVNLKNGSIVDYAVLMKRMDTAKEMDKMLKAGQVSQQAIITLAGKLAAFHRDATVIQHQPDIAALQVRFNDLLSVQAFVGRYLGAPFTALITRAVLSSDRFLERHSSEIMERYVKGFVRDLHGDLHTANIFLYDDPVIFDCIEFNEAMRELDVLDELAFLCMDIEVCGRKDLSSLFYREYNRLVGVDQNNETIDLYNYYKCYRANVRAKVLLLRAGDTNEQQVFMTNIQSATPYLQLLGTYLAT